MKILVLSSHTPSLFWFRLDMMLAFQAKGAEVIAVGPDSDEKWFADFKEKGIEYRSIPVSRNGLNVFADIKTFKAIKELVKEIRPDKIFTHQGFLVKISTYFICVYPNESLVIQNFALCYLSAF